MISKLARWLVLLFSVYVLISVLQSYLDGGGRFIDLSLDGVRRIVLFLFSAASCIALSCSLHREWRLSRSGEPRSVAPSRTGEVAMAGRSPRESPLRLALRRRPWHVVTLGAIGFCVPLLYRLTATDSLPNSTWVYWRPVVFGELLVGVLLGLGAVIAAQRSGNSA